MACQLLPVYDVVSKRSVPNWPTTGLTLVPAPALNVESTKVPQRPRGALLYIKTGQASVCSVLAASCTLRAWQHVNSPCSSPSTCRAPTYRYLGTYLGRQRRPCFDSLSPEPFQFGERAPVLYLVLFVFAPGAAVCCPLLPSPSHPDDSAQRAEIVPPAVEAGRTRPNEKASLAAAGEVWGMAGPSAQSRGAD